MYYTTHVPISGMSSVMDLGFSFREASMVSLHLGQYLSQKCRGFAFQTNILIYVFAVIIHYLSMIPLFLIGGSP